MSGTGTNSQRDARMKTARLRARSFEVDFNLKRESLSQTNALEHDRFNLKRSWANRPVTAAQGAVSAVSLSHTGGTGAPLEGGGRVTGAGLA